MGRFCLVGRISKSEMPVGRNSEVVNLCHVCTHGHLDTEARFASGCSEPLLRKSLASQPNFTKIVIAVTIIVCFTSDKTEAPRGGAAAHG